MRSLWLRLWKFLPSLLVAERFDTLMKGDRRSGRRCRLQLENLESRELLNSAPIAYDSSLSVVHNQSAWATAMYSDPDSGDSVSVSGYSQPAHGSVTFDGIDQFTYTPTTGYKGEDSFTFTVSDGQASAVGTFFLTVTNTAPEVYDSSFAQSSASVRSRSSARDPRRCTARHTSFPFTHGSHNANPCPPARPARSRGN